MSTEIKKRHCPKGAVSSLPKLDGALFLFIEMTKKGRSVSLEPAQIFWSTFFLPKSGGVLNLPRCLVALFGPN